MLTVEDILKLHFNKTAIPDKIYIIVDSTGVVKKWIGTKDKKLKPYKED